MTRMTDLNTAAPQDTRQYTLSHIESRFTQAGDPYKQLTLDDAKGRIKAYVWERTGLLEQLPHQYPVAVQVQLCERELNHRKIADVLRIHTLDHNEVQNAAMLLAQHDCPAAAQEALLALVHWVEELGALEGTCQTPLRRFMNRVLLDAQIAHNLTTCKSSMKSHHNVPGGHLMHSMDVLQIVTQLAKDRLSPLELAITQMGAFFHDLGKLRVVGSTQTRPEHYKLGSHEQHTLRLLEPHLAWLKPRAPEVAAGLSYILEYLSKPASDRSHALFIAADMVAAADRMSAGFNNGRRLEDLLAKTLPAYSSQPTSSSFKRNQGLQQKGFGKTAVGF
ncbi:MAG: HD domain-containing protein [Thermomonas sp.]|uniref:HD domain-containing protein n=1 Tax=Thermomonas sp. TaxID=1971895 RepID=UPI001EBDA92E|nr:HD domain-containing protein [Thermomonas sp.]MBV2208936.1 HD domain-containing protein [Thermomonas sp.]